MIITFKYILYLVSVAGEGDWPSGSHGPGCTTPHQYDLELMQLADDILP